MGKYYYRVSLKPESVYVQNHRVSTEYVRTEPQGIHSVCTHRRGRGLSEKCTFAYKAEGVLGNMYIRNMTAAIHLTAPKIQ